MTLRMIFWSGVILENDAVSARGVMACLSRGRYGVGRMKAARELWARVSSIEPRLLDGLLALALTVAAGTQFLQQEPGNVARLIPVAGTCLPLAVRRRWPLAAPF